MHAFPAQRRWMDPSHLPHAVVVGAQIVGIVMIWYITAKLSQTVVDVNRFHPLWIPTGISLAALLVFGPYATIGIFLGAFVQAAVAPSIPLPLAGAVLLALAETLGPLCAYLLLRKVGFRSEIDRFKDALTLVFLGAFGSTLTSAITGVSVFLLFGGIPLDKSLIAFFMWWTSDVLGVLAITPFLLSLRTLRWRDCCRIVWSRWLEMGAILVCSSVVTYVATEAYGAIFIGFIFVGWAAWRYQLPGAAPAALLVSLVAIVAATEGLAPFTAHDVIARMILLQLFNGAAVLGGLLLAAAVIERNRTRQEVEQARIATATDETRRRIERDLHDGVQQRLVSAMLKLRTTEASAQSDPPAVREQLAEVATELAGALDDLREISRGVHPAILTHAGIGPALRALARRSTVPVELALAVDTRLPESVELAAYYVVAEALTNTAKHAHASSVHVAATIDDGPLHLTVHDDGIGGADPAGGTGLTGLTDRVAATGGTIAITSPPEKGTTLEVRLPIGNR